MSKKYLKIELREIHLRIFSKWNVLARQRRENANNGAR